ncbi:MAG: bacillithiol biosynthesis deacetylase BshB1 [Bacteroidetes bacterium]|nr:bacillithiol biosynthesis deacetylase BshB1 [Bacteroidota bacterium]
MPANLDVLAFAAHPDDVELFAGGTVCRLVELGYGVGIVDLTRGELGSRGTPELRMEEATAAADIMGIAVRKNLGMPDGDISNTVDHRIEIIRCLRRYRPDILLINAPECRHPDHGAAARLLADSVFYSGLTKIETAETDGQPQDPWRPHHVMHYMQSIPFEPTIVVDVSDVWEKKMDAIRAFGSQFHQGEFAGGDDEPQTFVSNPGFLKWIEARARTYGYRIGAEYGEPFLYRHGPIGTDDPVNMLRKKRPFR